jgi:hypothetical protein
MTQTLYAHMNKVKIKKKIKAGNIAQQKSTCLLAHAGPGLEPITSHTQKKYLKQCGQIWT